MFNSQLFQPYYKINKQS